MKGKKDNSKIQHITKAILIICTCILCVSIGINIFQAYNNFSLSEQKNSDATSLQNYRNLQTKQIAYVKNKCFNGYNKYGADGSANEAFNKMFSIAVYQAKRYVNINATDFVNDLIFDYLQSECLDSLVLLLGEEDIYGDNLYYFSQWGYFHFNEQDFEKVKW